MTPNAHISGTAKAARPLLCKGHDAFDVSVACVCYASLSERSLACEFLETAFRTPQAIGRHTPLEPEAIQANALRQVLLTKVWPLNLPGGEQDLGHRKSLAIRRLDQNAFLNAVLRSERANTNL